MKKSKTMIIEQRYRALKAFETYLKEEFPEGGVYSDTFTDIPASGHFVAGYGYGCKDASRQMAEMRARSLSPKRRSEIARKAAKVSAAVRSAKAKARKENLDK